LIRLSLGLSLGHDHVQLQLIASIELDEARALGRRLLQTGNFTLQPVKLSRKVDPTERYPGLLPSRIHTSLLDRDWVSLENVPIHSGSIFASQGGTIYGPTILKINLDTTSLEQVPSATSFYVPGEDLERIIQSDLSRDFGQIQDIVSAQLTDVVPPGAVFPKAIISMKSSVARGRSFILQGKSGSGKTHSALLLAAMSHLLVKSRTIYLDCKSLKNAGRMIDILDGIRDAFRDASREEGHALVHDLSELVVDLELDALSGSGVQTQQPSWAEVEQSKLIRDHLIHLLESVGSEVTLVITCEDAEAMSSIFAGPTQVSTLHLPLLGPEERADLFVSAVRTNAVCDLEDQALRQAIASIDFEAVSRSFMPCDLCKFATRVASALMSKESTVGSIKDAIHDEVDHFVPTHRDGASLESNESSADWGDIGGMFVAKESLLDAVFRPSIYRRIYERSRTKLPCGILLYGPSGCGKSLMVPALAKRCKLPLIMCRGPELLDRYIGGSEAKVRDLFGRAHQAAPCILFLDEFDALAPKRGSDSTGVTDRVVNQLLTFLDGVEDFSSYGTVYIIAATSRPPSPLSPPPHKSSPSSSLTSRLDPRFGS
jgi:peroxin-1